MEKKILYFEGAGLSNAPISKATIGNCRIRTAFHLNNGKAVYLEIIGMERTKEDTYPWKYFGFVDFCCYIDDHGKHSIPLRFVRRRFGYTESEILKIVNSLGADFDAIKVVPDLGGYPVHKEHKAKSIENYNYGDEFSFDQEMIDRRKAIYDEIYKIEKEQGKKFPNFSMWVDEEDAGMLHLLRHFTGYNKHYVIRTDIGETLSDWMNTMTQTKLGKCNC